MINIILATVLGVSFLGGLSFLLVWYGEHSRKRAMRKYNKKFHFIDKYLAEMETASERQMELRRQERVSVFMKDKSTDHKEEDKLDIAQVSGTMG